MGINYTNNYRYIGASTSYSIYTPFWKLKEAGFGAGVNRTFRMNNGHPTDGDFYATFRYLTLRHFYMWGSFYISISKTFDYYEPRSTNYYYISPGYKYGYISWSSSYSKPFALDGSIEYTNVSAYQNRSFGINIAPLLKIGNRIQVQHSFYINRNFNNVGYAGTDTAGLPLFGLRDIDIISNTLELKYTIKNYMPVSIRIRHYYSEGNYEFYAPLLSNGHLSENSTFAYDYDFTFNSFNIDLVYSWQFSPGSTLSLIWKNNILKEDNPLYLNYFDNFEETLSANQYNSLTLKVIYYIDYEQITAKKSRK